MFCLLEETEGKGGRGKETDTRTINAVALVAEGAFADDFAVRVGMFVGFDVAGS